MCWRGCIGRTPLGADPVRIAALNANKQARLVPHVVAPNQGKLLELLVRGAGATRVL
jgi:predicted O-methyltransferase YrrM